MKTYFCLIVLIGLVTAGCGKNDLEQEKDKVQKQSNELKMVIDSTQIKIDSAKKDLNRLMYKLKRDSAEIDSLMKKINPLRK